jgi:hypothetical protein
MSSVSPVSKPNIAIPFASPESPTTPLREPTRLSFFEPEKMPSPSKFPVAEDETDCTLGIKTTFFHEFLRANLLIGLCCFSRTQLDVALALPRNVSEKVPHHQCEP